MNINAFIFDLDGTLVDTELLWANAMQSMLHDLQCHLPQDDLLKIVFGRAWSDIYFDLVRLFPKLGKVSVFEMGDNLRGYYLRMREDGKNTIIKSSAALLAHLAASHPVIIVSGSPRADIIEAVKLLEAERHVRFVLGSEDYTPGKPSPAGFLLGAQKLGVPPMECLVFEDSRAGVTAAKAAGMWCVALQRPSAYPQCLEAADWILDDLATFSIPAFARIVRTVEA